MVTPEQYLELDRKAERKSEYFNGEMFAMAGASREHNLIATNTAGQISSQLRSKPCEVYQGDMRVRVVATGLNTYPDIVIVCGTPRLLDGYQDTLLNPKAIIEILSPSTEAYDRGRKFEQYGLIESLEQYLLLSQDRVRADLFSRQADGTWLLRAASRPEESVELSSVGCRLSLAESYEKVEFSAEGS